MRRLTSSLSAFLCLALAVIAGGRAANAAPAASCDAPHEVDKYQLLRRLSLDLRNRMPSIDEYDALDKVDSVSPDTVRAWLKTDEFRLAMRRYHEAMFWPNVSAVKLNNVNAGLSYRPDPTSPLAINSASRRKAMRGNADAYCADYEQKTFDPAHPGEFRPVVDATHIDADGTRHDGWRLVTPYWAPGTQVKICAYEAQETLAVTIGGKQVKCSDPAAQGKTECGCGPGLQYCYGPSGASSGPILSALREQLALAVDDVTVGAKGTPAPYTDLLLSTKAWQNGPIAFWKKNLAPNYSVTATYNLADPDEDVLPKDFTDTAFKLVDRKGLHAGVVTMPAYLLRFQTDRGRANRFRINFLCQYFVPPDQLTDAPPACGDTDADLQKRCNCRYCHQTLEPLASYWGSFAEAGTTQLTDRAQYPLKNAACIDKTTSLCTRFWVTASDAHNPGALLPYQWTDVHQDLLAHIDGGPRLLARQIIDSGEFARCAVKRAFLWFVRRELRISGTENDELALLNQLADGFAKANYSFPWLVEQIVELPQYRRVR